MLLTEFMNLVQLQEMMSLDHEVAELRENHPWGY